MSHQSDTRSVHLHVFRVPCAAHGRHVFVVSGMDHSSDDAAFHLLKTLKRNGVTVEYDHTAIPINKARSFVVTEDWFDDDVPQ